MESQNVFQPFLWRLSYKLFLFGGSLVLFGLLFNKYKYTNVIGHISCTVGSIGISALSISFVLFMMGGQY